jgi:nitrate reductase (cytochrome), electron transfer subunit
MEKPGQDKDRRIGKLFLIFAGICIISLPFVVLAAFSYEPEEKEMKAIETQSLNFDHNGKAIFESFDRTNQTYLAATSTERTLEEYYSRRQYPGSPPYIPHRVEDPEKPMLDCLACHANGGWTQELKRHTPLTPHAEQTACRQCHVQESEISRLFVENDWVSVAPPQLGRSHLPGGPVPIPHGLQMRGDCVACHVGPGAVTSIRVDHPARGNCRQCHVPDLHPGLWQR